MPRRFTRFRLRVRSLVRSHQVERELDEELRYHLERDIEARIAAGMDVDEARRAARRTMGAITQNMEECRDMRGVNTIEHMIQDLRFAARQLLKHRGFAGTAILVLALGVAASVSIFGFVDAALIKPLPYQHPSRLVTVFGTRPELLQSQARGSVSYLDFLDWRARNRVFDSIAAYDVRAGFTLTTPAGPQRVPGLRVSAGFFRTLGVTLFLGREFHPDEEGRSAPATVILSYRAWQTRFHARPDVLGQSVALQSPWLSGTEPHVVIGVLPAGFHFTMAEHAEFWTTIRGSQPCWDVRGCRSLEAVARLADGASVQTASANVRSIVEQLRHEYPEHHRHSEVAKLVPLGEVMLGNVRPVLLMLLGGAGLLLLIACINVVSLLLARSDSRTREIAVRNALGASSIRLLLQFTTEAVLLAALGAGLGLTLAAWGMQFLTSLLSFDMISRMPYLQGIGLNLRSVSFACAVSTLAALVFTFTPVVRMSISRRVDGLKEGSRGSAGTTWRRIGAHLVVAELAVTVILLVGAGLLGKSLYQLLHRDAGFNVDRLATLSVGQVSVHVDHDEAHRQQSRALARQVADRVAALPGVEAVGYADLLPLGPGLAPSSTFWIPGRSDAVQLVEDWPVRRISAGYFRALQARLVRGRYFTDEEVASTRLLMIINETAARRYFRNEDPIGKSIAFGGASSPVREIVGVIADIKDGPLETPAHPAAYIPFDQSDFGLVVRTSQSGQTVFTPLAAAIHESEPGLLVHAEATMTDRMNRLPSTSLQRSSAWLVGGFAATAFVISVIGLYAVVAYSVGQRTREIGVRMALGAPRRSVYRLVMGEATWLVAVGTTLGLIGAVISASQMRGLLFEVQAWDPPTLAITAGVLIASALLASYIPARRAASVNPVEVLRAE
jgi:predicted permease